MPKPRGDTSPRASKAPPRLPTEQSSFHNLIAVAVVFLTVALLVSQLLSAPPLASPGSASDGPASAANAASQSSARDAATAADTGTGAGGGDNSDMDSMFTFLDEDGNGKISHLEFFKKARNVVDGNLDLTEMWVLEDANADGAITRDEFGGQQAAHLLDEGDLSDGFYEPPPEQAARQQLTPHSLMQRLDADADGKISRAEFDATFASEGQPADEAIWRGSDSNGDGFVDIVELERSLEEEANRESQARMASQAADPYAAHSAYRGGYDSFQQSGGGYGYGGGTAASATAAGAPDLEAKVRRRNTGGFGMDDVAVEDDDVDRGGGGGGGYGQQQRYRHQHQQQQGPSGASVEDIFDTYDGNSDGRISQEEFFLIGGRSDEAQGGFDQADRNGDEYVSFEELEAAIAHQQQQQQQQQQGADGEEGLRDPRQEGIRIHALMDLDKDGTISLAEVERMQGDAHTARDMMAQADANGDGEISVEELVLTITKEQEMAQQQQQGQQHPGGTAPDNGGYAEDPYNQRTPEEVNVFAAIDGNKDGVISKDEFWATEGEANPAQADVLWNSDDRNGDGFLEWDEFSGPKGKLPAPVSHTDFADGHGGASAAGDDSGGGDAADVFAAIDRNGDGVIAEEEFWATEGAENPASAQGLWDGDDANGDGFLEWHEFSGPKGAHPPRVAHPDFVAGAGAGAAKAGGREGTFGANAGGRGSGAAGGGGHRRGATAAGGSAGAVYMKHQ